MSDDATSKAEEPRICSMCRRTYTEKAVECAVCHEDMCSDCVDERTVSCVSCGDPIHNSECIYDNPVLACAHTSLCDCRFRCGQHYCPAAECQAVRASDIEYAEELDREAMSEYNDAADSGGILW